jgi:hypothetical protein
MIVAPPQTGSSGEANANRSASAAEAALALGLPPGTSACLFDLDGVLTQTAQVHAAAWKEMFDSYLRARSAKSGKPFVAFDPVADYDAYVDGKARADGTRSFLAARGIELPEGTRDDPPGAETVQGLGNGKNEIVLRRIRSGGVDAYEGSVRYVRAVREAGLRRAVVSSSQHGTAGSVPHLRGSSATLSGQSQHTEGASRAHCLPRHDSPRPRCPQGLDLSGDLEPGP